MGYDLHITRKVEWSDEEGPVITEAEFRQLVAQHAEYDRLLPHPRAAK